MTNLKAHIAKRRQERADAKAKAERLYDLNTRSAAMALFDDETTTPVTLLNLETSVLVSFFVGQYGNEYPLSEENRRFHKVAEDIRNHYMEIRDEARFHRFYGSDADPEAIAHKAMAESLARDAEADGRDDEAAALRG